MRVLNPQADSVFKDNYVLDFLAFLEQFSENTLQKVTIANEEPKIKYLKSIK